MVNRTTVRVEGLSEMNEKLKKLSDDVKGRIARAAVTAGAVIIRDRAIALAPVSDVPHGFRGQKGVKISPGNLKRNIIAKRLAPGETQDSAAAIVALRQSGHPPTDAFYGRFVEFGTVKMPAQPFMRPAFEQTKEAALNAIRDRIATRLNQQEVK